MPFQNIQQPRFIFNLIEYAKLSGSIVDITVESNLPSVLNPNLNRVVGGRVFPLYDDNGTMIDNNLHYFTEIFDSTPYKDKTFFATQGAASSNFWNFKIEFTQEFAEFLTTNNKIDSIGCFGYNPIFEEGVPQHLFLTYNENAETLNSDNFEKVLGTIDSSAPLYNGFILAVNPTTKVDLTNNIMTISLNITANREFNLNSIFIGKSFTIDNNPNMNISIAKKREQYNQQTSSGYNISSSRPSKQLGWGSFPRWTLLTEPIDDIKNKYPDLYRIGNRKFDMGYTHISDSTILPENVLDTEYGTPYNDNNTHILAESESFYANMMLLTHNGVLPFIFQSDKDEYITQNFSFCKLEKAPAIRQTAFKAYDIRMQFAECF